MGQSDSLPGQVGGNSAWASGLGSGASPSTPALMIIAAKSCEDAGGMDALSGLLGGTVASLVIGGQHSANPSMWVEHV